jgi:hypothetical protein
VRKGNGLVLEIEEGDRVEMAGAFGQRSALCNRTHARNFNNSCIVFCILRAICFACPQRGWAGASTIDDDEISNGDVPPIIHFVWLANLRPSARRLPAKNGIVEPFIYKKRPFYQQTGSGQTYGKLKKRCAVFRTGSIEM